MLLSRETVAAVERLLAEGCSQRQVAEGLKISRKSVCRIAARRRPPDLPEDDLYQPPGTPARCRGCGGMVYLPCRLCYVRGLKHHPNGQEKSSGR